MKMMDGFKDVFSKAKDAFAGKSYDEDGFEDDFIDEDTTDYEEIARPARGYSNVKYMDSYKETKKAYNPMSFAQKSNENVRNEGVDKVVIYAPRELSDATYIANDIKASKTVVVNMSDSSVTGEVAQRICDFLGGVCYAVDAKIESIANNILIVVPSGCKITNAVKSDIRKKSMGFASGFGR